ncbi:MAG: FtsQ-type POTRA domain-containing protein [Anaerovoracaceae bacterium]
MSEYQTKDEFYQDEISKDEMAYIKRTRKKRKKKHYLVRFLVFIVVCVGLGFFVSSSFFDVTEIKVENNHYYKSEEIINMANAKVGGNIFWEVNKSEIIGRLEGNPYFEKVQVKRKFPNVLIIDVAERAQVAAIVYGDKYVVIDTNGVVLRKTDVEPKLTLLKGLTISKLVEGQPVEAEEKVALGNTLKMLTAMENGNLYFKKIEISKVLIKAYIYDMLICKGTPKQVLMSIENGDLQKVLNKLFKSETKRGTITLGSDNYVSFSPDLD